MKASKSGQMSMIARADVITAGLAGHVAEEKSL